MGARQYGGENEEERDDETEDKAGDGKQGWWLGVEKFKGKEEEGDAA